MGELNSEHCLALLSKLLFQPDCASSDIAQAIAELGDSGPLRALANSHHVILRTFPALRNLTHDQASTPEWVDHAIAAEQARIHNALTFLSPICHELESIGDVIVIKSLDHWPDLGSDLDLYTTAESGEVVGVMRESFEARLAPRSWGDRLANKWNFIVPGLPELVEVHVGRLGQTGEQVSVTNSLVARSMITQIGAHTFRVPRPEDRLIISTLQRMYRHFYLRLCDIADITRLADSHAIDYDYLRSLARSAGIFEGLSSYLTIIDDYVTSFRTIGLPLPSAITAGALLGAENVTVRRNFLRIPIFPQAVRFYANEWKSLLFHGDYLNTARLSLLPGLAAFAALAAKLTGSDKGIW